MCVPPSDNFLEKFTYYASIMPLSILCPNEAPNEYAAYILLRPKDGMSHRHVYSYMQSNTVVVFIINKSVYSTVQGYTLSVNLETA